MLTATEAHKISKNANKDITKVKVKHYVKDILVDIKKDAEQGYCRYTLDLTRYHKSVRMNIIHMLEDLGYKVRPHTWSGGVYIVNW